MKSVSLKLEASMDPGKSLLLREDELPHQLHKSEK
jgi:hypothetical protein